MPFFQWIFPFTDLNACSFFNLEKNLLRTDPYSNCSNLKRKKYHFNHIYFERIHKQIINVSPVMFDNRISVAWVNMRQTLTLRFHVCTKLIINWLHNEKVKQTCFFGARAYAFVCDSLFLCLHTTNKRIGMVL